MTSKGEVGAQMTIMLDLMVLSICLNLHHCWKTSSKVSLGIDIDHMHWIAKLAYKELTLTLLFVLLFSAFCNQVSL
jgi:protein-arginine kinase